MNKLAFLIQNPKVLKSVLLVRLSPFLTDKQFIKLQWRNSMSYPLDLEHPKTFNAKLQWLKLYNRRPEYTVMVDKVKAKEYVASILGEKYIIPLLGVWDDPENIDFDALPDRFVIKCNHNSGTGMYICKDKSKINVEKVKTELRKGLKENYYLKNREWPYKNVPRKIFAEAYMEDEFGELRDYKFFCFNGEVKALYIASNRSKGEHAVRFDFFDENFNHLPFTNAHPNADGLLVKPKMFDEMKNLAAKLSKGIPHVRIDFYEVDNRVYFGEMTFFHMSGLKPFVPEEWDYKFGELLKLPH